VTGATRHSDKPTEGTGGYEAQDLRPLAIGVFGILVAAAIGLGILVAYWFYWYSANEAARTGPRPSALFRQEAPKGPRLQVDAPKDLREFLAEEDTLLHSYGWVNRQTGTVRIPIDQAMQILAERASAASAMKPSAPTGRKGP
jgi:hypothetical protein